MANRATPSAFSVATPSAAGPAASAERSPVRATVEDDKRLRPPRVACRSTVAPCWSGSGRREPFPLVGPIFVKSLAVAAWGPSPSRTVIIGADADGGVPRDRDGVLHALVRRAALGMQLERALGRFSRVRGHRRS